MVAVSDYINAVPPEIKEARQALFAESGITDRRDFSNLTGEEQNALMTRLAEINRGNANVSDFVDHIDYVVEPIGIEHVRIGSDFD